MNRTLQYRAWFRGRRSSKKSSWARACAVLMPATTMAVAFILVFAYSFLATLSALAQVSNWDIDSAHSTAQFTVRHMAISNVTGNFTKVTGSVVLNDKDITHSQVSASIDINSID